MALLILCGGLFVADRADAFPRMDKGQRPVYVKTLSHPDVALSSIVYHLTHVVPADVRPFVRYFWWGDTPDDRLVHDITTWFVHINKVSSQTALVKPTPIPGTDFRLWAVDLRDFGWTINAFAAVAHRDITFVEPNVDHFLAEKTRRLIGVAQDPKFVHAEAVVHGPWFLWTIMNPGRSKTTVYYDLLYARERFGDDVVGPQVDIPAAVQVAALTAPEPTKPQPRPWHGGYWPPGSKAGDPGAVYYDAGAFPWTPKEELAQWEKDKAAWLKAKGTGKPQGKPAVVLPIGAAVKGKAIKDFPEDLKQFQDRWGRTANRDFLDSLKIFVEKGAVVAGSYNAGAKGSYVAYNDRVIRIQPSQFDSGANMDTQDFDRTSRAKNAANLPRETTLGLLEEDAGENLYQLPNGFQATFIHNAAKDGRKRVDHADSKFVHNSLDAAYDVTIWDGTGSCTLCHARSYGALSPSNNKIEEARARGVRVDFLNKADQLAFNAWGGIPPYRLDTIRAPYKYALEEVTKIGDAPPWNGTQLAEATSNFIRWYNAPVDENRAAAELGVPKIVLLIALKNLLGEDNKGNFDSKAMFVGLPAPISVWEDDLKPELQKVIALMRDAEHPNPILATFAPELLRQTIEKVGGKRK